MFFLLLLAHARPTVCVSVHGAHATEQAEAIGKRLTAGYTVVETSDADLFIDVDAGAENIVVEVRDRTGVISREEVSTLEDQRDVLVWLVVHTALERAAPPVADVAVPDAAAVPTAPSAPAPTAALATASAPVPTATSLTASALVGTGADLSVELGARGAARMALGLWGLGVDAGYRRQRAGDLTLDAFPVGFGVGAHVRGAANLDIGARLEVAPKLVFAQGQARVLTEVSCGPALSLSIPLGSFGGAFGDVDLDLGVEAMAKLFRQAFVLDAGHGTESPWRAQVDIGVGWRWD